MSGGASLCPFCRREVEIVKSQWDDLHGAQVTCRNCGTSGPRIESESEATAVRVAVAFWGMLSARLNG